MKTDTLLLNRVFGTGSREQCVEWAVDQMVAGADTPSLRILAGLNPQVELDEVEEYFQKAAREMGIQDAMPSRDLRRAADIIWRCYSDRELTEDGVIDFMAKLYAKSEYQDALLNIWFDIREELAMRGSGHEGCFYPPAALKDLKALVQREWQLFRLAATANLPKNFLQLIRCQRCGHIGKATFTCRGGRQPCSIALAVGQMQAALVAQMFGVWKLRLPIHVCPRCARRLHEKSGGT